MAADGNVYGRQVCNEFRLGFDHKLREIVAHKRRKMRMHKSSENSSQSLRGIDACNICCK